MSVTVFGPRSIYLGCQAALLGDGDERAMAWAEKHIMKNPTLRYIVGKYVEADNPNENGHLFPLANLRDAAGSIAHTPLNLVHRPQHIVGHFMATELHEFHQPEAAQQQNPYIEALSAFYSYYFPQELKMVEAAHKTGELFYSMECIPQDGITCPVDGCGLTTAYVGLQSPSYCEHMNARGGAMRLNRPWFTAGALIVPPTKPGWKRADITQLSALIQEQAEMAFAQVQEEAPHLGDDKVAAIMQSLLERAADEAEEATARRYTMEQRREMTKKGHAIKDKYPIETLADLTDAIKLFGRAKDIDNADLKTYILKRARELGASEGVLERIRALGG